MSVTSSQRLLTQNAISSWSSETYSPLLPLALLLCTGLYLFVVPYATKWLGWRRTDSTGGRPHDATQQAGE
jgi:hypothetical protein